jgi:hypothetical protein
MDLGNELLKVGLITRVSRAIAYNGPAIWGGCVTRRKHRAESRFFSQKVVSVAGS